MSIRRLSRKAAAGLVVAPLLLAALVAGCDENFIDPALTPGSAGQVRVASGNDQFGFVGTPLREPLRVQVVDSRGRPAPQQRVEFRTLVGDGVLSSSFGVTDFAGFTQVVFTPLDEGDLVVEASRPGDGGGASAVFALTALDLSRIEDPARFEKVGGDNQTGSVGTIVPLPLAVRVANEFDAPLEDFPVVFTATTDGTLLLTANAGDFTQRDSLGNTPSGSDSIGRQVVSFTDRNGIAAVLLRLRTRPGSNQVTASTTFATGSNNAVVFNATGTVGGASSADSLAKVSGDEQTVRVDTTKTPGGVVPAQTFNPMVVQVTDRFGNPIAGVRVLFRVSTGSGSVSPAQAVTDADGFAQTVYSSPQGVSGGFAVSASAPGVGTVTFTGEIIAEGTTAPPAGGGGGGGGGGGSAPTLNSLSPPSATAGGAGFPLTVNGSGFASTAEVRWNGSPRTTTFNNSGQVTAAIPATDIAVMGSALVTVVNSLGGTPSNALPFTIN
jgi:hypothetical protein